MPAGFAKAAVLGACFAAAGALPVEAAEAYRPVDTQTSGQPLPPREAVGRMRLPNGFKVTLAAAEPDVRQPIAIAYDARGRLWVAESYSYQGADFNDEHHDRVLIFEDRDGDGVFETRKVFHDRLNRLTGLAVGFGGVWVTTPPTLSFIPDRDHDDRPDGEPEVHLDGWTLKAEHNSVNGLAWGPDGWLYGRHGIKDVSHPGRPGVPAAERAPVSCAIWRYHPTRHVFDVVAEGTINPWGLDFDEHGQMFISTSVVDHLWHVVPGAKFRRWVGRDVPLYPHIYDVMGPTNDHSHRPSERNPATDPTDPDSDFAGGAAHAEALIYLGDRWPADYRGSVLLSNIHGRRINLDRLQREPEGGRYVARHAPDFLRANDPWFRAVSLRYGPDGDVVMTDWSDFGECHDRDGVHRNSGRIYKISWGEPRPVAVNLTTASLAELVEWQRHSNEWFPRHARQELQERAAAGRDMTTVQAELRRLFAPENAVVLRLRALWALFVTGGADAAWLATLLEDREEHVRHWAVRLLADAGRLDRALAERLIARADVETSWLVRLGLASALSTLDGDRRWSLGATLARRSTASDDPNLLRLVWMGWEPSVAAQPAVALEVMAQTRSPEIREWIARRVAEASAGDPALLRRLLESIRSLPTEDVAGPVAGLALGLDPRKAPKGAVASDALQPYYGEARPAVRRAALKVGAMLRDETAVARLRAVLNDPRGAADERAGALDTLVSIHAEGLATELLRLVESQDLLEPALRALAGYDDPRVGAVLVGAYAKVPASVRSVLIDTLIARPASLQRLLDAMEARQIPPRSVTPGQARQVMKTAPLPQRRQFEQLWGRINSSSAAVAAQIKRLRATMKPEFLQLADRAHGAELFAQRCAACHTLFGRGGKLAPDLTGSGRKEVDYLILNVVDPNAEIPADWRLTIATLQDGRVISGSVAAETADSLTLQSAEGVTTIERAQLRSLERMQASLMPTGLLDDLPPEHIRDLFGFLMSDDAVPGPAAGR